MSSVFALKAALKFPQPTEQEAAVINKHGQTHTDKQLFSLYFLLKQ